MNSKHASHNFAAITATQPANGFISAFSKWFQKTGTVGEDTGLMDWDNSAFQERKYRRLEIVEISSNEPINQLPFFCSGTIVIRFIKIKHEFERNIHLNRNDIFVINV